MEGICGTNETKICYFFQWRLKTIFCESFTPGLPTAKNVTQIYFLLEILPRDRSNLVVTLTNAELKEMTLPATTR